MALAPKDAWRVSLHGGHSSRYCDHASDPLETLLEAAIANGFHTYGVTEHAPRVEAQRLYDEEVALGWDSAHLNALFREYARELDALIPKYAERLTILKGFEAEVVPESGYREIMTAYKNELHFDYMVGSVHYVAGHIIDYTPRHFEEAVEACDGLENLGVRYYQGVSEMVETLHPEVVGHFDLISQQFPRNADVQSPRIRKAALEALETIRDCDSILDINTSGYRKGMNRPFPGPSYLDAICDLNIAVCFGDDSHSAMHVGYGMDKAQDCLLKHRITRIAVLAHSGKELIRHYVSLT